MNKSKQLFTLITSEGELEVSLKKVDVPQPKPHEVIVRMEASPINPSDMWPMFGPASLDKATFDAADGKAEYAKCVALKRKY